MSEQAPQRWHTTYVACTPLGDHCLRACAVHATLVRPKMPPNHPTARECMVHAALRMDSWMQAHCQTT
jgi:hypothetical protein